MPVTLTLDDDTWHLVLREAVYVASTVEAVHTDVGRGADRRRDAWVLSTVHRLGACVSAQDRLIELLSDAQARPVPVTPGDGRPSGRSRHRGGRPKTRG